MRFAGVDIGAETHVVALVDDDGQILLKPTAFTEDAAGYDRLFEQLGASAELLVAMEATAAPGRTCLPAWRPRRSHGATQSAPNRFAQENLVAIGNSGLRERLSAGKNDVASVTASDRVTTFLTRPNQVRPRPPGQLGHAARSRASNRPLGTRASSPCSAST